MESSDDVVGVDILLFPVEEEEKAPSPSELPMPNFGFQDMEIAGDFQPPSGRDVPNVSNEEQQSDHMEDNQDHRTRAYEEVASSSSSNTKTSEVHSDEDSDRSIKLQAKPKASGHTPKGSVGVALSRQETTAAHVGCCGACRCNASRAKFRYF